MNAFVPSSVTPCPLRNSAFAGTQVAKSAVPAAGPPTRQTPVAAAYSLDKYEKMSQGQSPAPETASGSSKPSVWWTAYVNSLKEQFSPFYAPKNPETDAGKSAAAIAAVATPYAQILAKINAGGRGIGGDPDTMINIAPVVAADRYMSKCVTLQYKATAVPNGVYTVRCTEGTVKGQAEESRSVALSSEFRLKHRSTAQKFGDFTDIRRKAIIACAGCTYEEQLVDRFPISARAVVTGGSEAIGVCARYAVGMNPVETYMAASVDKQSKFRAVPFGIYDVLCCDGNAKTVAEYKRVSGLSARFRAGQLSKIAKERVKFDAAKYARDYYGHGCDYEEDLFNKYPSVAESMRPAFARY